MLKSHTQGRSRVLFPEVPSADREIYHEHLPEEEFVGLDPDNSGFEQASLSD